MPLENRLIIDLKINLKSLDFEFTQTSWGLSFSSKCLNFSSNVIPHEFTVFNFRIKKFQNKIFQRQDNFSGPKAIVLNRKTWKPFTLY